MIYMMVLKKQLNGTEVLKMIKLTVPDIGEEELDEIKSVLESKYLVQGNKVQTFELLIKDFLNVKHAIAVSSGTAALHLAIVALDIKKDDEVIVPDFTFPATSNVIEIAGANTKFVDIKLEDFCIDPDKIEKKITNKTKAIIPVHEFGHTCNMDKILKLAKKYKLKVVEDAACALGAKHQDKMVGTLGDIGCFSLHPRKAITTGEGGIIATNNDTIAEKIRVLRNHGLCYIDGKPKFVVPGFNYRMTDIQGALGIAQMKKLILINKRRREIADYYNILLSNVSGIILPKEKDYGKHIWQTYHILLDKNINRDYLIQDLKEKGIETNFGAYSVHEQPYYKEKYNYLDDDYPNSLYAHKFGLALPLYKDLSNKDIEFIVTELKRALNELK